MDIQLSSQRWCKRKDPVAWPFSWEGVTGLTLDGIKSDHTLIVGATEVLPQDRWLLIILVIGVWVPCNNLESTMYTIDSTALYTGELSRSCARGSVDSRLHAIKSQIHNHLPAKSLSPLEGSCRSELRRNSHNHELYKEAVLINFYRLRCAWFEFHLSKKVWTYWTIITAVFPLGI